MTHTALRRGWSTLALMVAMTASTGAYANGGDAQASELMDRMQALEDANTRLRDEVNRLSAQQYAPVPVSMAANEVVPPPPPPPPAALMESGPHWDGQQERTNHKRRPRKAVGIALEYSYDMLDHAEGVNNRLIRQLKARRDGELDSIVTIGGGVTAIANAHWSNRANKFGYLMRHPSGNNQRTKATQEIALNNVQLAFTATPTDDITAYAELLYDPEQSFGSGTTTALARNQVQLRKAYVMFGNLDKTPLYVAAGKMDVPFGLQDTVSPFTNSTNWHAFAPLAYGGQVGYYDNGLSVRAMAVLGGAQFRSANTPVDGTNIPSKLNNFAVDANYSFDFGEDTAVTVGGSYIHGSAYCQAYPVFHFNPCAKSVPAWAAYGRVNWGGLELLGEFAQTLDEWPGTQVPDLTNPLSQFPASKVTSFTVGGRYTLPLAGKDTTISLEYSRYIPGPKGSPWHRQNQVVLGLSRRLAPSVDLFSELIHVDGFAPLNFISGGNQPNGATWSDASARSNVAMMGVQAAF